MSTRDGGKPEVKDLRYSPPQGPLSLGNRGPGLGGTSHGNAQKPSGGKSSGSPGIGGTNHGSCGSQSED